MLRLGTRGSPLALAQAHEVRKRIAALGQVTAEEIDIVVLSTQGDRIQDRPLNEVGGKGLFTKELERALLDNEIDVAVHSLKDVSVFMPEGLCLPIFLPREDVRDVLLTRDGSGLNSLPEGAVLGTASLRRQALIKAKRPDLKVTLFRGAVQTRLDKLNRGEADATLLALAGLKRLGKDQEIAHQVMDVEEVLPAMGQGAISLQLRSDDIQSLEAVQALNHAETEACVTAERACLAELDGSCRTPIAGYAQVKGDTINLRAFAGTPDGTQAYWHENTGPISSAAELGRQAGLALREKAGQAFFDALTKFEDTWRS